MMNIEETGAHFSNGERAFLNVTKGAKVGESRCRNLWLHLQVKAERL